MGKSIESYLQSRSENVTGTFDRTRCKTPKIEEGRTSASLIGKGTNHSDVPKTLRTSKTTKLSAQLKNILFSGGEECIRMQPVPTNACGARVEESREEL